MPPHPLSPRCVHLLAELSQQRSYADEAASLLPMVAEAARHNSSTTPQHRSFMETVLQAGDTCAHTHTHAHTHISIHTHTHTHRRVRVPWWGLPPVTVSLSSASCWAGSSWGGGWSSTTHSLYITIQFVWRKKAAELSLGWVYSSNLCNSQNCFGANLVYMYLVQFNTTINHLFTYKQKTCPFLCLPYPDSCNTFLLSYTLILYRLGSRSP